MSTSSFLLLGRSHAGVGWLCTQLAIGVVLCVYAWQALLAARAQQAAPSGIDEARVLVVPWLQATHGADPGSASVLRTLRAVPGVQSVAAGNQAPYGNSAWSAHVAARKDMARRELATVYLADDTFLPTLGMDIALGRPFASHEYQDYTGDLRALHTDPAPAIISAALAKRLYGGADPLGRSLHLPTGAPRVVIGVIAEIPLPATAHRRDGEALLLPVRMTRAEEAHFFVRHAGDADAMSARLRRALAATYPDAVVAAPVGLQVLRMRACSDAMRHAWTSVAIVVGWWLSSLGMLAIGGHRWVQDRRQELSLRRAFGATGSQLARTLCAEYLLLAIVASLPGAWVAASALPHVVPAWMTPAAAPWMPLAASGAVIALVQLGATWPAGLARRIPPHLVSRSPSVRL